MRCAYFDCFSGVAGDMLLGALVDAGLPVEVLRDLARRLDLPGVTISAQKVQRHGLAATHVQVSLAAGPARQHRHLPQILARIDAADLPPAVAAQARRVFERLADAEAAVHGIAPEKVHFHEVGADDALIDIVGTCVGLAELGVAEVRCGPIPPGSGTISCEHGLLPVPAPATALLLRGAPLAECDEPGELTTPTGAALLTTLAAGYGPPPAVRLEAVGCGAGARVGRTRPNVLRVLIGSRAAPDDAEHDTVVVLETQVDDATGQTVAYACERLLAAGALDVFVVPMIMKKGRPGQLLTVLCEEGRAAAVEGVLLEETPTFGVRRHVCTRRKLARHAETVATPFGPIRVKVGRQAGAVVQAGPEYDECAAAAREHGVPLRVVQEAALSAWRHSQGRDAAGNRG